MSFIRPVDNIAANTLKLTATPDNFKTLGSYVDAVNAPDNREQLVNAYGSGSVSGMLGLCSLVGAVKTQGVADEVTYWEKARLHKTPNGTIAAVSAADTGAKTITTATDHNVITGNNVLINGKIYAYATSTGAKTFTVTPYKATWGVTFSSGEFVKVQIAGSEFKQGSDQPTEGELSNLVKRTQPYMITKFAYPTTGSQLGNKSWVRDDSGTYSWSTQGLEDMRLRVQNYHESQAIFGELAKNSNLTGSGINGAEGYKEAVLNRGIVKSGYITDLADLDELIIILNKQRSSETEYVFFANKKQTLYFDSMIAAANQGGGSSANYGMFNNDESMALKLGFKALTRGGITFYCKDLTILNDPTFGGQTDTYRGFMVPMGTTTGENGIQAPMLELNVKTYGQGGQNRWMEEWVSASVDGIYNRQDGKDIQVFQWRSEYNLISRGTNAHVLIQE